MIQSLSIRNIALIEQLTISFHDGLQVLSGETGAGKSIVVDAVNLVLGGRADRAMIRSGCEKASVEAVFVLTDPKETASVLDREGIEFDGQTVSVYREITSGGRNICRICGVIMPVAFLKEISLLLLNLHGQSEHQFLADPHAHLGYLDQLGDTGHHALMEEVRENCARFIANHRAYARMVRKNEEKESRMSRIIRDLDDLHRADIHSGEDDELKAEIIRLDKAGKISEGLKRAYHSLISSESDGGALQMIRQASCDLKAVSVHDPEANDLAEKSESLFFELEDLAYRINGMLEKIDYEPCRMEQAEQRLDLIRRIEKKYGSTVEDVLDAERALEDEYSELCGLEEKMKKTGAEHKRLLAEYRSSARALSESRRKLADRFSEDMMRELRDLGMQDTIFSVRFSENQNGKPKMPSSAGDDEAEFMISPNPGEPLMPLAKIASGGELSRLMLAMKTLEAGHTGVDCMVFDEIDTGISGKTAQTVAEKMIAISRFHQVICVSHLPQLAAAGDFQYLVSKHFDNGRTVTRVTELDRNGRVAEIARMVSGAGGITGESSRYAEQMLSASEKLKQSVQNG